MDEAGMSKMLGDAMLQFGGPTGIGAIVLLLVRRLFQKQDEHQKEKFDALHAAIATSSQGVVKALGLLDEQGKTLAELTTKIAVHDVHAQHMSRALDEHRAMNEKQIQLEMKSSAAFRVIDELKTRVEALEKRLCEQQRASA